MMHFYGFSWVHRLTEETMKIPVKQRKSDSCIGCNFFICVNIKNMSVLCSILTLMAICDPGPHNQS